MGGGIQTACTIYPECVNAPCGVGGECSSLSPGDFQCRCLPGYSGGGFFDDKIGSIHPAKLVKSMIHLVHKKGGLIFDKTTFKKSERNGKKFDILTNKGLVKSNHLIIATNAYTDKNIPWLRKKLIPVISEMISTCEIGNNRVNSLMPKFTTFGESLNLFYYFKTIYYI